MGYVIRPHDEDHLVRNVQITDDGVEVLPGGALYGCTVYVDLERGNDENDSVRDFKSVRRAIDALSDERG